MWLNGAFQSSSNKTVSKLRRRFTVESKSAHGISSCGRCALRVTHRCVPIVGCVTKHSTGHAGSRDGSAICIEPWHYAKMSQNDSATEPDPSSCIVHWLLQYTRFVWQMLFDLRSCRISRNIVGQVGQSNSLSSFLAHRLIVQYCKKKYHLCQSSKFEYTFLWVGISRKKQSFCFLSQPFPQLKCACTMCRKTPTTLVA